MSQILDLDYILPFVRKPSRYIGTEVNACCASWEDVCFRVALVFPDLYEIGMSHLGLQILYHILNDMPDVLADRAYCPDIDLEKILQEKDLSLWGLETKRPLKEFDLLAISLPYELCYVNILTILNSSNIPLWSRDRGQEHPFILGGGSCSVHTEPVAPFFDAILVGDGEEAVPEIVSVVKDWKGEGRGSKEELYRELVKIEGVYIPELYRQIEDKRGIFIERVKDWAPHRIKRRILSDLSSIPVSDRPLVPYLQIVHDRLGIEIARGCTRSCRFCQAGVTYRPVRERPLEQIVSMSDAALDATGFEEMSLLSLSTGDYSCIDQLVSILMDTYVPRRVSVSLPSLRVGTLTSNIMSQIRRVRKTGFTMAPEAGTERLRRVINKGITEEDLLDTAKIAFGMGWLAIKLYFMIGLPTETREDILEIAALALRVLRADGGVGHNRQIIVSVGTFVPKPHTPFQWERQITPYESQERLSFIKGHLKRGLKLRWQDAHQSYLEGVFSRGDRRLSRLLVASWNKGARLDAWGDCFCLEHYMDASEEIGLPLDPYLDTRSSEELLPWSHIDAGVSDEYLKRELNKAMKEESTSDCRYASCQRCGVCDFDKIRPLVFNSDKNRENFTVNKRNEKKAEGSDKQFWYVGFFSKLGLARFLSHLEVMRVFQRAVRRAGIPLTFSNGFHPRPRLSFGPPVPVGTEALEEPFIMSLYDLMPETELTSLLNRELPDGFCVKHILLTKRPKSFIQEGRFARYIIPASSIDPARISLTDLKAIVEDFASCQSFPVSVVRNEKTRHVDLKDLLSSFDIISYDRLTGMLNSNVSLPHWWMQEKDGFLYLEIDLDSRPRLKPSEIARAVFSMDDNACMGLRIMRLPCSL